MKTLTITRPCKAHLLHLQDKLSGEVSNLETGTKVSYVHHTADQDGWDGEIIVRLENGCWYRFTVENRNPLGLYKIEVVAQCGMEIVRLILIKMILLAPAVGEG